jgi:hypothetical protein
MSWPSPQDDAGQADGGGGQDLTVGTYRARVREQMAVSGPDPNRTFALHPLTH